MTRTTRTLLLVLVALMLLPKLAVPNLTIEDAKKALGEMLEREKKCGGFFEEYAGEQAWKDLQDDRITACVILFDHGWAIQLKDKQFDYYYGLNGIGGEFVYEGGKWHAQTTWIYSRTVAPPSLFQ